jgi:hypothetical protein
LPEARRPSIIPSVWLLAVVVGVSTAIAPVAADPVDRARDAVLDDSFQPDFPHDDTPGTEGHVRGHRGGRNGGPSRLVPVDDDDGSRHRAGDDGGDMAPIALVQYLVWALVIVGAAVVAFSFAQALGGYGGDAALPEDRERDADAPDEGVIVRPLGDADELARLGRYAEAIHTLLLRTLQELARSAALQVAPAETSREILARVPLLGDARVALAGLVTAVEITHFGDDEPSGDDYARCRQQFNVFAQAFRAGSAR